MKFDWDVDLEALRSNDASVEICINNIIYRVSQDTAALTHCLMLLNDSIIDLNKSIVYVGDVAGE